MKVRAGTSGYSYKEWKGTFYPAKLSAAGMLPFYAERFSTVEINNTFYRMPSESVLLNWAAQVPDGFAFVLKAPRRITHDKRLKNADEDVSYLLKTAAVLGKKRGPLLFQTPPFLQKDLACLRDFLGLLSADGQSAFEFRHQSWFDEEVFSVLREHDAALCLADAENELQIPFLATASWGYVRLRRPDYSDADLGDWAKRTGGQPGKRPLSSSNTKTPARAPNSRADFWSLSACRQ